MGTGLRNWFRRHRKGEPMANISRDDTQAKPKVLEPPKAAKARKPRKKKDAPVDLSREKEWTENLEVAFERISGVQISELSQEEAVCKIKAEFVRLKLEHPVWHPSK